MQGLDVGGTDIPRAELQHPRSFLRICNAFATEQEHSEADAKGNFTLMLIIMLGDQHSTK